MLRPPSKPERVHRPAADQSALSHQRVVLTELMGKLGSVVRRVTKWDAVTERRYRIGLWVLVISLVLPTVILFVWHDSVKEIDGRPGWAFWLLLASTFGFIGAVMSMGAPFWLRVQAIFTWTGCPWRDGIVGPLLEVSLRAKLCVFDNARLRN